MWIINLTRSASLQMAVDGSGTSKVFSAGADPNCHMELVSFCLLAEFNSSFAVGSKFISSSITTLSTGLLLEGKLDDVEYAFGNLTDTKSVIRIADAQSGPNILTGSSGSLVQIFFTLPSPARIAKAGTYTTDDYIKATVRDDLTKFSHLEMYIQSR